MTTLLIIVLAMVLFSFLLQRPLKKQQEAAAQMRESLGEGSRVMLTTGLFGTVTHVGAEQVIVELAPGVEVTCLKQAIAKLVAPEDEEFVFADETDEAVAPVAVDDGEAFAQPVTEAHPVDGIEPGTDGDTMTDAPRGTGDSLGYPEQLDTDRPRTN
ncbi:preprotein translocase subunit YajC [Luteococcus peritonei]|uniref:Preprotein translocase subunit YajC n=1 Tax=Luteococcus peritonei TaxID=88874 RepID=A0ABW4RYM8_9ACTN